MPPDATRSATASGIVCTVFSTSRARPASRRRVRTAELASARRGGRRSPHCRSGADALSGSTRRSRRRGGHAPASRIFARAFVACSGKRGTNTDDRRSARVLHQCPGGPPVEPTGARACGRSPSDGGSFPRNYRPTERRVRRCSFSLRDRYQSVDRSRHDNLRGVIGIRDAGVGCGFRRADPFGTGIVFCL